MKAYRVSDVRAAEDAVLARVPDGALMQRAAAGLAAHCARLLRERRGGVSGRRVVLLVGGGDNGGDALYAGARLAGRGAAVTALLTSENVHPGGLAALRGAGGRDGSAADLAAADLVLDGVVGIGGRPGLRPGARELVAAIPATALVVAVDLPSGAGVDTGELPGDHVTADLTVTFGAAKPCHLLPPAAAACGEVRLVDLGLDLPAEAAVERLTPAGLGARWPVPKPAGDKYRRGVLGLVAGSAQYPGAAVLVAGGALRAGVGMVRYAGPDAVRDEVRAHWPEIVGPGRVQAWVVGPGIDGDEDRVAEALDSGEPCVVDAGALPVLAGRGPVADPARVLLTPHAGELARLLGADRADVEARPYEHAARAAARTNATVLLKGATTIVVRPDGRARSQADGPPWLATAGAGDTLAGIAGALLAGGLDAFGAGSLAAAVHGMAATAASAGGPVTVTQVADAVPATVARLVRAASRGWETGRR